MIKKQLIFCVTIVTILCSCFLSCNGGDDDQNNGSDNTTDVAVTGNVSKLGVTYAFIDGYVNLNQITASYNSQQIGIEISLDEEFKSAGVVKTNELVGNKISILIDTLSGNTKYYYRTIVKINSLSYYGEKRSFVTNNFTNIISIGEPYEITEESAIIKCEVDISTIDKNNNFHIGLVYTTVHPDSISEKQKNGYSKKINLDEYLSGNGRKTIENKISGLKPGTTYYYYSYTMAGSKQSISEVRKLTTKGTYSEFADNKNKNLADEYPEAARLEFPKLKGWPSLVLVHRTNDKYGVNFCTEWDTQKKSQRWSCYQMHSGNSGGNVGSYTEGYTYDDQLNFAYYFTMSDGTPFDPFMNSGYDHGHICPSADRRYSKEANRQTFFLTNMQPQRNVFNAGVWQQMEQQVKNWNRGSFSDTLYVCKGGTIDRADQISRTLSNGLIVPMYFFMAILCKNNSGYKAIGFWIEHKDTDYPKDSQGNYLLSPYVTNIRELETLTGIDFFCNLDDETENNVETLGVENIKGAWGLK